MAVALYAQQNPISSNDSLVLHNQKNKQISALQWRKNLAVSYQEKGFLLAWADSIAPDQALVHKGKYFDSIHVVWNDWNGRKTLNLNVSDYLHYASEWLIQMENSGYPFSYIKLMPGIQDSAGIQLEAFAERGDAYTFDTFVFKGFELSPVFMKWAAGIQVGKPYNHKAVLVLQNKLGAADGFYIFGDPQLAAIDGHLFTFVQAGKAMRDQLSGLAGLATVPGGRPVITGELSGKFYNMFRSGVYGALEWRSFKARSQELRIQTSVPYLFGMPFNTRLNLAYEKYDTLYSAFTRGLSLKFPLKKNLGIWIGANYTDRYRIYADLSTVSNFRQLPENPPSRNSMYQIGLEFSNLQSGVLPVKGLEIALSAGAGTRKLVSDPEIGAITWLNGQGITENIYDSLKRVGQMQVSRYKLQTKIQSFVPLKSWMVLRTSLDASLYRAPQIYFNELERFGGIKNLRGFNEQSIFANEFYMATAELRFVTGNQGYIGPFYHLAWFNDASKSRITYSGWLQGTGIQTGFRTAAGILNLAWAISKTGTLPFSLNQSRFHAGISATF
ncbi:MAG: hypothetical protein KG003_14565 [Bacteroidetes bacterium]|nr:hypothetical protein [Bacteroidota bacterium]